MRKVDGWHMLATKPTDQIDLAASPGTREMPEIASPNSNTTRDGTSGEVNQSQLGDPAVGDGTVGLLARRELTHYRAATPDKERSGPVVIRATSSVAFDRIGECVVSPGEPTCMFPHIEVLPLRGCLKHAEGEVHPPPQYHRALLAKSRGNGV
jgi:hypothetical protein